VEKLNNTNFILRPKLYVLIWYPPPVARCCQIYRVIPIDVYSLTRWVSPGYNV